MTLLVWSAALVAALFILTKSAGLFVDHAKLLGRAAGLSPFVIGVVIVGFGTSLPEFATSFAALLRGATEIVTANAIGSNITNILLIVGMVGALSGRLILGKNLLQTELPIFAVATVHFVAISVDGTIDRLEGGLLVGTFIAYLIYLFTSEEHQRDAAADTSEKQPFAFSSLLLALVGLAGVIIGAKYAIDAVITIGGLLAVPIAAVSITAVALGTSLPELAVSIVAMRKGHAALAVGNIFGSNAFNLLVVVGVPALIMPLSLGGSIGLFGLGILAAASFLLFVNALAGRIIRWEGWMFLLFYAFFLAKVLEFSGV